MTTIAYRRPMIAADRSIVRSNAFGDTLDSQASKIHRVPKGWLIGSGCSYSVFAIAELINGKRESLPEISGDEMPDIAIILDEGQIYYWRPMDIKLPVEAEFIALGSGAGYALGAMAMGADARQAVEVAARFDCYTSVEIDVQLLQPKAIKPAVVA